MADNVTTQSTTLATVPAAETFRGYAEVSGIIHFPVEYITGGSAGAWTFQGVDATHGLPVSVIAGTAVIGHVIVDSGAVTVSGAVTTSGTVTATLSASELHIGEVAGKTTPVRVTITRTGDGNAYAANDAINVSTSAPTIGTLSNLMRANDATGYLTMLKIVTNQSTCVARLRVHFFLTATPTLINDNAPYTMLTTDDANYLGAVDLPAFQTEGSGSDCARAQAVGNLLFLQPVSGGRTVYFLLETLDAFTPASSQTFKVTAVAESN